MGRKAWGKEAAANRQARVENAMHRLKSMTGDRLTTRSFEAPKREAAIRVRALNIMTELGMPDSYAVGA